MQGTTVQDYTASAALAQLLVNTGGILDTYVGTNTINAGSITTTGNVQLEVHVTGSSTTILNINAFLLGNTGGLVKADGGTLNLNNAEYYAGPTTVNGGVLNLSSTAQSLLVTPSATVASVYDLQVNGGILNLNADQAVARIGSLNYTYNAGSTAGTISNASGATINLTSDTGTASVFGGVIGGGTTSTNAINFYKDGSGGLTLTNANTYSGSTNIIGGTLTLQDSGTILNSGTVNINGGTLALNNSILSNVNTRIASSALVNLNSGSLTVTGANYTSTSVSLGTTGAGVTAATGFNTITATAPAATTNNVLALTIGNLTRTAGTGADVSFIGSTLGSTLPGSSQVFLTNINTAAPALIGGILGGWATTGATAATNDNWATYAAAQTLTGTVSTTFNSNSVTLTGAATTANLVVGQQISGTGIPAGSYITAITSPTVFTISQLASVTNITGNATVAAAGIAALNSQAYNSTTMTGTGTTLGAATTATANYQNSTTGTETLFAGGNTVNSLQFTGAATVAQVLDLGNGVLTITSGGLMRTSVGTTGTTTIQNGTLTAGTGAAGNAELNIYGNNTAGILLTATGAGVTIADNASTSVSLVVKTGTGGMTITSGNNNTYTGGTVINGGTLTLSSAGANGTTNVVIPAGAGTNGGGTPNTYSLVINSGGAVTETLNNQIAQSASVLINGSGALTLTGANTLYSLTLNNSLGGNAQVNNVAIGSTSLTLTAANAITEPNNNFSSTPVISGTGSLILSNAAPVVTVSGLSTDSLIISAPISSTGGNLLITGGGSLVLSGASTFTGGTTLDTNTSIIFGASTTGSVTNGPVGTGTLTLNNNSTILSDGTVRTIANATSVQGNVTVGGTVSGNSVILSGGMGLASGAHTITVTSPQVTATITGTISGGTNITKSGAGTLIFTPTTTNSYGGSTTVAGGVLQLGSAGGVPSASSVIINAGAAFDINAKAGSVGSLAGGTSTTGGLVTNSNATTAATLTVGNDGSSTTFAGVITAATPADLALTKTGAGNQTLSGINTYTGATTVNGGTLTLQNNSATSTSATLADTAITVAAGATFGVNSTGASTTVNAGNNVTTAAGASLTLSAGASASNFTMADGAISTFNLIQGATFATPGLTIGSASGTAPVLTFDLNGTTSDVFNVTKSVSVLGSGGKIAFNVLSGTSTLASSYTFMNASAGLGVAGLTQVSTSYSAGGHTYTGSLSTSSATAEILTLTLTSTLGNAYWYGGQSATWNTYSTGATNWSNSQTTITDAGVLPAFNTNVFFTVNNPPGANNLTTTLGENFTINSLNFLGTGTSATSPVSISGNTLTINAGTANGNTAGNGINVAFGNGAVTLASNVVLGASQTWTNNSSNTLTVSNTGSTIIGTNTNLTVAGSGNTTIGDAIQTGSGSLTMSGTGTLSLSGSNTYTGGTNINGGIVQVNSANALGTSGTLSFGGGTLQFTSNNTTDYSGQISTAANQAVSVDTNGQNVTFASNLSSSGGSLTKLGAGTLTVSGSNSYSGATTISAGVLSTNSLAAGGSNSGIGASTNAASNLVLNGGTLQYTGGTASTDRNFTVTTAGGTLDASGTGALTISGGMTATGTTAGSQTLTLTGSNTAANTLGGAIVDGTGGNTTNVAKTGAGTWVLSATNTYSGTTTVSGGNLQVTGALSGTGAVSVAGSSGVITSAPVLSGTGTIAGAVTVGTGVGNVGVLAPGITTAGVHTNGTLTVSSAAGLTINQGSQVQFQLSSPTTTLNAGDLSTLTTALANGTYNTSSNNASNLLASDISTYHNATNAGASDVINVSNSAASININADSSTPVFKLIDNATSPYSTGAPAIGQVFALVDWTFTGGMNLTGTTSSLSAANFDFSGLPGLTTSGLSFDTSAFQSLGILIVVPEPSRMLLLMLGLFGLCIRRRRRYSRL